MQYAHLAAEIFEQPLMIHAPALQASLAYLSDRGMNLQLPPVEAASYSREQQLRAGYESVKGVGIINVFGKMLHRGSGMDALSGLTSYSMLSASVRQALADEDVHRIAMIYHTPGGVVHGAFDLAELIREAHAVKPVTSIVSDMAASAGYLLASAGGEVVISQTSLTGNVGVVWAHVNNAGALAQAGKEVTYIYAGDQKIDGAPTHPLSAEARERAQTGVDDSYAMLTDAVARYRGMSVDAVRGTQAAIYQGAAAISAGLADRVSSEAKELSRLFAQASSGAGSRHFITAANPIGGAAMSDPTQTPTGGEPNTSTVDINTQLEAAKAEGHTAGTAAERARISGILRCEAAEGRAEMAATLALETDMDAEQAAKVLATAPVAQPQAAKTDFEKAMDSEPNPDVGAGGGEPEDTDSPEAAAKFVLAAMGRAPAAH